MIAGGAFFMPVAAHTKNTFFGISSRDTILWCQCTRKVTIFRLSAAHRKYVHNLKTTKTNRTLA